MTVFGKILVFINLVFSLLVCALVLMVFIARTNWHEAHRKKDELYQSAVASAAASAEQAKSTMDLADSQVKSAQADRDRATKELATATKALADKTTEHENLLKTKNSQDATIAKMQVEVQKRADEVKTMETFVARTNDRITEVVKEMNKLRDRAVAAEIESKGLRGQNQNLVTKLEESQKDLIRARTPAATVAGAPTRNPPPENVEGIIKGTDSSGLVTITIGSDSGVLKGHTLEVFRLDPVPAKSMYLGTIRILEVRPNEAVGQPLIRPRVPIEKGDRVASRIAVGS